jgi:hypothetical protein
MSCLRTRGRVHVTRGVRVVLGRALRAARRLIERGVRISAIRNTASALVDAELALPALASNIRSPNEARSFGDVSGGMFAARAADIYAGFVHALEGPSKVAPTILVRPLVELAIQTHWIALDPERK